MEKVAIDAHGNAINLDGLPDEVVSELRCVVSSDTTAERIISIMPRDGSGLSLDQILVCLYRSYGLILKRRFLQNKLYRMKEIDSVAGTKGRYTLHPAFISERGKQ